MKPKKLLASLGIAVLGLSACGIENIDTTTSVPSAVSESQNNEAKKSSSESTTKESNNPTSKDVISTTSEDKNGTTTTSTPSKTTTTTKTTIPDPVITETEMKLLKFGGDQESIYAEFNPIASATEYHAYYKTSENGEWIKVDDQLIRKYKHNDSYKYRVDVVGIKEGSYDLKIESKINGIVEKTAEAKNLTAIAYDRSGFAFSKSNGSLGSGSGAYNDDGTLKNGAQVIYVDSSNAKTVQAVVNGQTQTGLQAILYAKQKKTAKEILDIRLIGEIKANDVDYFASSSEGIQVKGQSSYSPMDITIEGIGEDATVNGFGFLLRNTANVEIRNIGVLNFMDDGISIDTDNKNLWIHDNDFFYGNAGGDSDQAKGDGTTDLKGDSQFITLSYNHYYDSGKSSLCGMKSESGPNYITYHHNWFDHSDSRHPRIRTMSVHVYNNYYDGNAKYGIGSTTGSSAFVESNYFRNCKHPMLISLQGTDILADDDHKGTFSGEQGGIIKAFNNTIVGGQSVVYYQENSVEFDAYLAQTRDEVVDATVKSKSGANSYNNFDTTMDLGVKSENIDSPEIAKENTQKYAGRLNGGDFKWTFTEADDADYNVNKELKSKVSNYTNDQLLSTLSSITPTPQPTPTPTPTPQPTETSAEHPIVTGNAQIYFENKNAVNTSNAFTYNGSIKDKGLTAYNWDSKSLSQALKLDSKGNLSFTLTESKTVIIVVCGKSAGTVLVDETKLDITTAPQEFTVTLEAGTHTIKKGSVESYIYLVEIL